VTAASDIDRSFPQVLLRAWQVSTLDQPLRNLEQAAFWDMPTALGDVGLDGDQLIIEGITAGKYHVVDRWRADPAYETLCRQILDLTGLKIREAWDKYHGEDGQSEM
jgi:hypothetical protein